MNTQKHANKKHANTPGMTAPFMTTPRTSTNLPRARLHFAIAFMAVLFAGPASAEVIFYENDGFEGRSFTAKDEVANFQRWGFNDRASSVVVIGERWEACENARFGGECVILRPGRYPNLAAMGMNNRVSSVRLISGNQRYDNDRYAPEPLPVYDNRRRNSERLYEADVTSVRAVVGPPQQRCWIEQEHVVQDRRGEANVPGALVGAVVGGVLGHQIGGGRGKDLATVGGVVAGAAIGGNVGRDGRGQESYTQNVQRCTTTPNQGRPEYWDVTYTFRGQEHRIQMSSPPGSTVTVNRRGEPRS